MKRALIFIFILVANFAWAVEPDEILSDPALEKRARDISADIRCVVCQNEPIDSSNASVARELRILIRERLVLGDTDQEVREYLVDRYGTYVLFKPPWGPSTYALWIAPAVIFLLGCGGLVLSFRNRKKVEKTLSSSDEKEIDEIMNAIEEEAPK